MSRTRTRVLDSPTVVYSKTLTSLNGGTCTVQQSGTTVTQTFSEIPYRYTETMVDVDTPGYYKKQRQGEIVSSPMTKTLVVEEVPACTRTFGYQEQLLNYCYDKIPYGYRWVDTRLRRWDGKESWSTCTAGCPVPKYIDLFIVNKSKLDVMKDLAVTRAWSNIDHSEILALAAIAESGKTYSSLKGLLKKSLRIIKAVRKKNAKLLYKELRPKELIDLYMEARYSLRPLYYDVHGLIEASSAKNKKALKDRYTFRGKEVFEDTASNETDFINSSYAASPSCVYNNRLSRSTNLSIIVRAGVLTKLDLLTNANIYGLTNLAETAWELVPFSFIVDWFANVGNTIGSWTPNIGSTTLASWVTTDVVQTQLSTVRSTTIVNSPPATGYRTSEPSYSMYGTASKTTMSKERIVNPPRSIIPHINVKLSSWKILDLGIIAKSLFSESNKIKKLRI